jgi:sugar-specific transcriptional regulator TrmB
MLVKTHKKETNKMQQSTQKLTQPYINTHKNIVHYTLRQKELNILEKLGLTNRQARVYIALLKNNGEKAKTIANISQVNRQEIYRVIDDLQKIGLIQKHITLPTTYSATPITDVIKILLTQKTHELTTIKQKTKQLTKTLQNHPHLSQKQTQTQNQQPCMGTIFEGNRGKKFSQTINSTTQQIDTITNWKSFKQLTTILEPQLQKAIKNNITIRIITEKPPNQTPLHIITKNPTLNKPPNLHLKTLPNPPQTPLTIFDQTILAIPFHKDTNLTKDPHLWTTNPILLILSQTHFNNTWKKATKPKTQKPANQ